MLMRCCCATRKDTRQVPRFPIAIKLAADLSFYSGVPFLFSISLARPRPLLILIFPRL